MLQLAFPRESNPNFPWEKSQWDNTVVKKTKNTEAAAGGPQVTDAIILPRIIFLKMSTFKPLNILSFSATRGSFVGWRKEITLGFVREWDGRKDRGEVF